jgi:hypothetical protein
MPTCLENIVKLEGFERMWYCCQTQREMCTLMLYITNIGDGAQYRQYRCCLEKQKDKRNDILIYELFCGTETW